MEAKGWIMLRVLLNRFHPKFSNSLLQVLPQVERDAVSKLEVLSKDPAAAILDSSTEIKKIHYSWLIPYLEKIPKSVREPTVRALPNSLGKKVSEHLQVESPLQPPDGIVKKYLLNQLFHAIKPAEVLPIDFLPKSELSFLADLSKQQLTELIDFLSIYDLAEEVRHIIDKEQFKKINHCLNVQQKHFLRTCLHQKEKVVAPRMHLKHWDGDCKTLKKILHRRGLVRLSKACCGQHPDLMWYLSHRLDIGRGKELVKHYSSAPIPGITAALIQQLIQVYNFLNKKSDT